jgi:hypothetical protein
LRASLPELLELRQAEERVVHPCSISSKARNVTSSASGSDA